MTSQLVETSDRGLADRVLRDGDEGAFRALYSRHTPYLYQFALRTLGGNEPEAEDVIQEAWIRAVEKLDSFRWEAELRSWLAGIVLNLCRGLFRRKDRQWLEIDESALGSPRTARLDERMDLEQALHLLPDGYRTVLVLHDLEGYTHEEIGQALGTTAGTSKSQLSRARRAMRDLLVETEAL
ncbi:MAG TPA: sigma-70 family RNA polymerase sigma factor [Gemmatimonadales bacterium]